MAKEKRTFFERLTGAISVSKYDEDELKPELVPAAGSESILAENDEDEGELAVDVYQTPEDIIIKAMVAGIKPEDLDISITRDMVTIKGAREAAAEISEENFFFRELYWGSFSRTILLPQEVEVEEAEASERNGLLTIRLPKVDKGRQTKLRVKSNG